MPRFIVTAEFDSLEEMNEWLNFRKETKDLSATPIQTMEIKEHKELTGKEITEEKIRSFISQRIGEGHRAAISAELKKLGADSVSSVKPDDYQTLWDFLLGLKTLT